MIETALLGVWSGSIVTSSPILMLLHFVVVGNKMVGYLDVPVQSVKRLEMDGVMTNNGLIELKITKLSSTYDGSFNSTNINGFWNQNGYRLPLDLTKIKNVSEYFIDRPQTPIGPFKYVEEDVTFYNKKANITLSGTLTYPKETRPLATVILAHGSGGNERDEYVFGHRPFMVIADYLTNNGIAVLRFDERGIGQSSGNFTVATDVDFAEDVIAGINYLRHRKETKCSKIGVIGHSKGGLTSMIVAYRKEVRFAVLLGSPGVNGEELLYLQTQLILEADNTDNKTIQITLNINRGVYQILKAESDLLAIEEKVTEFMDDIIANSPEEDKPIYEAAKINLLYQLPALSSPWFRNLLVFEPKTYLKRIKIPVLGLWGSKDLQVPPKQSLPAVEEGLKLGHNINFKLVNLNGLNHLFQNSTTGAPSEYETIRETFSPVALKMMNDWILSVV